MGEVIHLPTKRRPFGGGRTPSLDDLAKDPTAWGALRILITTGQLEEHRVVGLCCDYPAFGRWLGAQVLS